ncbi:hypothetical protein [Alkalimarinus alittae]|nr:hypothetical protein [Alkalimarinus alittae]
MNFVVIVALMKGGTTGVRVGWLIVRCGVDFLIPLRCITATET